MRDYYLFLNQLFYDSPGRIHEIVAQYKTLEAFKKNADQYVAMAIKSKKLKQRVSAVLPKINLEALKKELAKKEISVLAYTDSEYPSILKEISDPPAILYYRGDAAILSKDMIGVVGTRACSDYGNAVTSQLVSDLLLYFVIVSGLAQGIDTIAHQTSVDYQCPTVAVLGTSIDRLFPKRNEGLFNEIIKNGCVISEYPPSASTQPYFFPQRNRIISGLSKGILVCEAPIKSGAMITARVAAEQNRDVFAVPGSILSNQSSGCHLLIQEGAKCVHTAKDIVLEYQHLFNIKRKLKKVPMMPVKKEKTLSISLTDDEKSIWDTMGQAPVTLDAIVEKTNLSIHYILQTLTLFEMHNLVVKCPGEKYKKNES